MEMADTCAVGLYLGPVRVGAHGAADKLPPQGAAAARFRVYAESDRHVLLLLLLSSLYRHYAGGTDALPIACRSWGHEAFFSFFTYELPHARR